MQIPDDLYYSDEHLWILSEGDIATIGISDYAQNELLDIHEKRNLNNRPGF